MKTKVVTKENPNGGWNVYINGKLVYEGVDYSVVLERTNNVK